jgi:hypothetical protein
VKPPVFRLFRSAIMEIPRFETAERMIAEASGRCHRRGVAGPARSRRPAMAARVAGAGSAGGNR